VQIATDTMAFDSRQRAIVKVHYFNHAGGGGAALKAHARYVARDAATRDDPSAAHVPAEENPEAREAKARAHAHYLSREGQAELTVFYDAHGEGVDGAARAEAWARSDKRHFRIILSAEDAGRLHDLPAYTRQVMARAEAALGTKLQWIAADHPAHPPHHPRPARERSGSGDPQGLHQIRVQRHRSRCGDRVAWTPLACRRAPRARS
jgi:type IV secretory pathway VirD2 relaxase